MNRLLAHTAFLTMLTPLATHAAITGVPSTDGWDKQGNSLVQGTYIRGDANFSYDVYTTAFVLDAASPLLSNSTGFEWQVGDQILGMGGVINNAPTGLGWSVSGNAINSQLTTSYRIVAKFGTSPSSWSASTIAPGSGNGAGSSGAGDGGNGAILIGTSNSGAASTGGLSATNEGTFMLPVTGTQYRSGSGGETNVDPRMGRVIYDLGSGNLPTSWETLLNVSLLARNTTAYGITGWTPDYPAIGDRGDLAGQRGAGVVTDALTTVPEPGTFAVLGGALFGLSLLRRRRAN